jgi:hypothetical protein
MLGFCRKYHYETPIAFSSTGEIIAMKYALFVIPVLLVLIAGCIDTATPTVSQPIVGVGAPHDIGNNSISLHIDSNITVPINNPRDDAVKIDILDAAITANLKDGTSETVRGYGNSVTLSPKQTTNILIEFRDIPTVFQFKENPLHVSSYITSYNVTVRYRGTVTLAGLIPYSQDGVYSKLMAVPDVPIDPAELTRMLNGFGF